MEKPKRHTTQFFHPSRVSAGKIHHVEQRSGGQVEITPTVKEFASGFKITKDVDSVQPVIAAVKRLKPVIIMPEQMRELYGKRTATDILHSGLVPIFSREHSQVHGAVGGCLDYGVALVATLRSLGLKADLMRSETDTYVTFEHGGEAYAVSSSRFVKDHPQRIGQASKELIRENKEKGITASGHDAWAVGIKSLDDFGRYAKKEK